MYVKLKNLQECQFVNQTPSCRFHVAAGVCGFIAFVIFMRDMCGETNGKFECMVMHACAQHARTHAHTHTHTENVGHKFVSPTSRLLSTSLFYI